MKALTNRRIVKVKEMEGQSYDNRFKKARIISHLISQRVIIRQSKINKPRQLLQTIILVSNDVSFLFAKLLSHISIRIWASFL